eukprot:TRINITY_DN13629_c0_g1_i1.p1 TRINITY_DN13629_c0_g1~~TRINITY_DN13629_c0_g1_i1.p1  ORF type:complete len:384 (+),score=53.16 TRINITY_DN13629_c0_g1_i1:53-1204(+)
MPPRNLEITENNLLVRVCSWNVAETSGSECPEEMLEEWLLGTPLSTEDARNPLEKEGKTITSPDIIAVGLQEVDMSVLAMCLGCCTCTTGNGETWKDGVGEFLHSRSYKLVTDKQMMGLMLLIWVKTDLIDDHGVDVESTSVAAGFFGVFGNKGGLSCRMRIPQVAGPDLTICFVNCHLAAKTKMIARRNRDYHKILQKTHFKKPPHKVTSHDYVFWFGDLNYRLEIPIAERHLATTPNTNKTTILKRYDQLRQQIAANRVFVDYAEPAITWCPSYKFQKKSKGIYDDRRDPSYCDRILHHHTSYAATTSLDGSGEQDSPLLQYSDVEMTTPSQTEMACDGIDTAATPVLQNGEDKKSFLSFDSVPIVCLSYTAIDDSVGCVT